MARAKIESPLLDMLGIDFIDSEGIGALLALQIDVNNTKGTLGIVNMQDSVAKTFRNMDLLRFLTCFDSLDAALCELA